ncbi:FAD binding domain-containing protein [Colletotrichum truncatum]|uniref:FAD binding domain-containing protein n=1 Tax=Colletotrichum truncatum TaxID=5467 RepID=A0ACC3YD54_COLTU
MSSKPNTDTAEIPLAAGEFRVIVVGAGIAGLTASHCLQKAGIKHVVLERRTEVDPPEGASFAIYPHGARILHQLGCLEAVEAACKPCLRYYSRGPNGRTQSDNGFFNHVKHNHGYDILLLERRRLLRILYDCLPDKSPIRTGSDVKKVTQTADGVEVVLGDGSSEKGHIILGCDGVYSRVRNFMWENAKILNPSSVIDAEKKRIQTHWKCLVGTGPPEAGLGERDMTSTSDRRFSFLALTQPDRAFWFVFFKLDKPVVWPQRVSYDENNAEELAQSLADHPVSETVNFGRLWRRRHRGVLIPLQEGILEHWYSGRVVLAGDAVHKMTPNIGLGGNTAIESVAVLCNHLIQTLQVAADQQKIMQPPTQEALERCFLAYQTEHRSRVEEVVRFSRLITRIQAWDSFPMRCLAEWIMPVLPDRALAKIVSRVVRAAPKLNYVAIDQVPSGAVEWMDARPTQTTQWILWLSLAVSVIFVVSWMNFGGSSRVSELR